MRLFCILEETKARFVTQIYTFYTEIYFNRYVEVLRPTS